MTYEYAAPDRLEDDWREGRKTPPEVMIDELQDDIDEVRRLFDQGERFIPIQGRVSDYKSWLAAAMSMQMADDGLDVTVFTPQRANRESAVFKLQQFGAEFVEHPGRIDLCIWEPWRDNVGHVDKATCEAINCPFYVREEDEVAQRTEQAMEAHQLETGGETKLDAEAMKEMGRRERQDMCPAQLYLHARSMGVNEGAVNIATYAKAYNEAAIADDDPLDSDVMLLDEAHTIAASPDMVVKEIDPSSLTNSLNTVTEWVEDQSAEQWAERVSHELGDLRSSVLHWFERSREEHVDPEEIFDGETVRLADAFNALDTVESRLIQSIRRALNRNDWNEVVEVAEPHHCARQLRTFLSRIKEYRDGGMDFVHSRYREYNERVNKMGFRPVDDQVSIDEGTTPGAVYEEWKERGTHPVIEERWGTFLGTYIDALWEGRAVQTTNNMPGVPMMPIDRLREISGADSVVTLSATHNEVSDPTRPPDQLRPTRHDLVCAPVNLRSKGSERDDVDGRPSVTPRTPWFRDLVEKAKEESGDNLAAVPINKGNLDDWSMMPVEPLRIDASDSMSDDTYGVVPHSRGSIGEKGLEDMEIDTVLCGVQAQNPSDTAHRLVRWWELLAPRYDDPAEVLEVSWRLLAQHLVSGTIQAGGRFDWGATNFVFERPELFELAGFDVEVATPDSDGFAGAFCRAHEELIDQVRQEKAPMRAVNVIRYLEQTDTKAPTIKQYKHRYQEEHGATHDECIRAARLAEERGLIEVHGEYGNIRFETT